MFYLFCEATQCFLSQRNEETPGLVNAMSFPTETAAKAHKLYFELWKFRPLHADSAMEVWKLAQDRQARSHGHDIG